MKISNFLEKYSELSEGEEVFKYRLLIEKLQQREVKSILVELDDIAKVNAFTRLHSNG